MLEESSHFVSNLLIDDYRLLKRYIEGKRIKKVAECTETIISFVMEDGVLLKISFLEDELLFDICLP